MPASVHRHDRPATAAAIALLMCLAGDSALAVQPEDAAPAAGDRTAVVSAQAARDPLRARIEALSESEAKRFYAGCSQAAMRGRLDGAGTVACSIGYEVLLRRHFGGDFFALLAWSRLESLREAAASHDAD